MQMGMILFYAKYVACTATGRDCWQCEGKGRCRYRVQRLQAIGGDNEF
jgi:hypothetical protein